MTTAAIERLLGRFDAVRPAGPNRWRCRRPGSTGYHVAVALTDDGRVLMHDHAGRTPAEILSELGLGFADLFPERTQFRDLSPGERRAARERLALAGMQASAEQLVAAAVVVCAVADAIARGLILDDIDAAALHVAHQQAESVRLALRTSTR